MDRLLTRIYNCFDDELLDIHQFASFSILVILFGIFFAFVLQIACKKAVAKYESINNLHALGIIPVNEIQNAHDFILEIHYAVSNFDCNGDNILRCMNLLNLYPSAINVALPPNDYTPFLKACLYGCDELILFLARRGADINRCTSDGDSAIYLATYAVIHNKTNYFSTLQVLSDLGCAINVSKRQGFTALHLAARFGHEALVRWLLVHGADPEPPHCPRTPYHYANKYGFVKVAALLLVNIEPI